ncbi:MAG: hypothetical protein OXC31_25095 [Spirochaetaceae bacterium]|nr:hypothetical protein [Spirochaetaceae bacterium]
MARPEAHGFIVGVAPPAGLVPSAARRSVASCPVCEDVEARLGSGVRSGVGVVPAEIAASCTVTA